MDPAERKDTAQQALVYVAIAVAVVVVLGLLWYAINVVLLAFIGVLLAILLRAPADWLTERTGLREGWSLALVGRARSASRQPVRGERRLRRRRGPVPQPRTGPHRLDVRRDRQHPHRGVLRGVHGRAAASLHRRAAFPRRAQAAQPRARSPARDRSGCSPA